VLMGAVHSFSSKCLMSTNRAMSLSHARTAGYRGTFAAAAAAGEAAALH